MYTNVDFCPIQTDFDVYITFGGGRGRRKRVESKLSHSCKHTYCSKMGKRLVNLYHFTNEEKGKCVVNTEREREMSSLINL